MMPGMPGGRQFAVWLSSGAAASNAFFFSAYSGVRDGPDGRPRGPAPSVTSHTPLKSGSLARAAQSAAAGAFRGNSWALARRPPDAEANTATTNATTIFSVLCIVADLDDPRKPRVGADDTTRTAGLVPAAMLRIGSASAMRITIFSDYV